MVIKEMMVKMMIIIITFIIIIIISIMVSRLPSAEAATAALELTAQQRIHM